MQGLKFEITHADGRLEQLLVESDRALIGSGAHCEIRLPLDQAQPEHVRIQLSPSGVVAEALSFSPPPTINDAPINRSPLTEGAVLGIGPARMAVAVVELDEGAAAKKKSEQQSSPAVYVFAAVAVPLCLWILFTDDPQGPGANRPEDEAPALFGKPIADCPQKSEASALAFARDKRVAADAKRERRPFYVKDGVAAVPLYETAAACYRAAGKADEAKSAAAAAKRLRSDVADDYRTHQVRLEHALSTDDWQRAQREVRVLLQLTSGFESAYVTWLDNLDRQLALKYGKAER